jgi:hypothetical protein
MGKLGRPRTRYRYEIPKTVVDIVIGICADYERRELAIKHSNITGQTLDRYIELNEAVEYALGMCDSRVREYLLEDVAEERGYDFSQCSCLVAKNTYYEAKRRLIYEIAKKMCLLP